MWVWNELVVTGNLMMCIKILCRCHKTLGRVILVTSTALHPHIKTRVWKREGLRTFKMVTIPATSCFQPGMLPSEFSGFAKSLLGRAQCKIDCSSFCDLPFIACQFVQVILGPEAAFYSVSLWGLTKSWESNNQTFKHFKLDLMIALRS